MNLQVFLYILVVPYSAWAISYFSFNLLDLRKPSKYSYPMIFLISLLYLGIGTFLRLYSITLGTSVIQICYLTIILFLYNNKITQKIFCYLLFQVTSTAVEVITINLFLIFNYFTSDYYMSASDVNYSLQNIVSPILIGIVDCIIGVFFFTRETQILKGRLAHIKAFTLLQIILPIVAPIIGQSFILYRMESIWAIPLSMIYWSLCILCYPIFINGLKNLTKQEEQRLINQHRLQLIKNQLEASKKLESEYQSLRKWNHDVENHLLALSYLMDMKRYDEASEYLKKISDI